MAGLSQIYKKEYALWNKFKNACQSKKHKKYYLYGAVGVTFSDAWDTFPKFFSDMGKLPQGCDSMCMIDEKKGFGKNNAKYCKAKRGMKPTREPRVTNKRRLIHNPVSFCLTINADHLQYIKRQAILRSQQIGELVNSNFLIREALEEAYPYSAQYDMFGSKKRKK